MSIRRSSAVDDHKHEGGKMKYPKAVLWGLILASVMFSARVYAFESGLWPGEGRPVFIAGADLTLQARPVKDACGIPKLKILKGRKIDFTETRYRTVKSGEIVVTAPASLSVTSWGKTDYLSPEAYYHQGKIKTIELKSGVSLEYLQYRAEGESLIRMEGEVLSLPPHENIRIASEPRTEWWVLAVDEQKQPLGWVLIDDQTVEFAERQF